MFALKLHTFYSTFYIGRRHPVDLEVLGFIFLYSFLMFPSLLGRNQGWTHVGIGDSRQRKQSKAASHRDREKRGKLFGHLDCSALKTDFFPFLGLHWLCPLGRLN